MSSGVDDLSGEQAIEVRYTLADSYALVAQNWHYWTEILALLAALLIGMPTVFAVLDGHDWITALHSVDWFFAAAVLALACVFILVAAALGYGWAKWKKLIVPTKFLVTEQGVSLTNAYVESVMRWSAFKRVETGNDRLFLFVTRRTAFSLPRRAFANDAQFDRWVEIAKRRWTESRNLAKSVTVE